MSSSCPADHPACRLSLLAAMLLLATSDGISASPPQPPQADPVPEPSAAFHILPLVPVPLTQLHSNKP